MTARTLARRASKAARDLVLDALDGTLQRRPPLTPPRRLQFVGDGDFRAIGDEFLGHLKRHAGLQPGHRVLEMGCGVGRMAIPLLGFLSDGGAYEGVDIVPRAIRWCTRNITAANPRFRFHLADIRNAAYNRRGKLAAADYRFPFESDSFDIVLMTLLFTHMLPAETSNYLAEAHRVLKTGGRCLATWFLLNDESEQLIRKGRSALDLRHPYGTCLVVDPAIPEAAIGYRQAFVEALYARTGLTIEPPIHFGAWCGRAQFESGQDFCVAVKPGTESDAGGRKRPG